MSEALLIRVAFPRGAYSGGDLGVPEDVPSPARLHAAFAAAAGGGPHAKADGCVLVAAEHHRAAIRWLEDRPPLAVIAPERLTNDYGATRFRFRARVTAPEATPFEPFTALAGEFVFAWPSPSPELITSLAELAPEITHVGRSDSDVIVRVEAGDFDAAAPGALVVQEGRGPGQPLRVATPGRMETLERVHRDAAKAGRHSAGSRGKQAEDVPTASAGEQETRLLRYSAQADTSGWPFGEVLGIPLDGTLPQWALRVDRRVALAVAVHRAVVSEIGEDVPDFVTGRDGSGPLRGAGHLAIHARPLDGEPGLELLLAVPIGVLDADRATLLAALGRRPRLRLRGSTVRFGDVTSYPALPFWPPGDAVMSSVVPVVLDAPGPPRKGRWTTEDAVVCSVGYALRGLLEARGLVWGTGWAFRRELVAGLRDRGVDARARRVDASPAPYVHRARPGDLLVGVEADVHLGDLTGSHRGFMALGRARHLGGGLMQPAGAAA